jgi:hypothetical protein
MTTVSVKVEREVMSSPLAPAETAESRADARPAVTVLSGFWPAATSAVAGSLLADDPSLLLIRHDLSGVRDGVVHRVVRTGTGIQEDERIDPGARMHLLHPARRRTAHHGPPGPHPS